MSVSRHELCLTNWLLLFFFFLCMDGCLYVFIYFKSTLIHILVPRLAELWSPACCPSHFCHLPGLTTLFLPPGAHAINVFLHFPPCIASHQGLLWQKLINIMGASSIYQLILSPVFLSLPFSDTVTEICFLSSL